jgi:hypothetical protein
VRYCSGLLQYSWPKGKLIAHIICIPWCWVGWVYEASKSFVGILNKMVMVAEK